MDKLVWYKKAIIAGLICGVCFAVGFAVPKLWNMTFMDVVDQATAPDVEAGEPVNILVLGIDARPGETNARSDTMILACIDPGKKKAALISIPRDSRVYVPGSLDKINSANEVGGPREACRAVERLMGVDVDYYVLTNFNGFAKCIDVLGGVTVDVEKRMYKPAEGINLRPGVQHLNGKDALAYCRFRGDALGDIARTQRQQKFITAVTEELVKTKNILKLPSLIPELKENVKTNMGVRDMLALAKTAAGFKSEGLICQTLPGYFFNDPDNGLSYWIVDKTKIDGLLVSLFEGRKVAVVEIAPYVPQAKPETVTSNEPAEGTVTDGVTDPIDPGTVDTENPGDPAVPDSDIDPDDPGAVIPDDPTLPDDATYTPDDIYEVPDPTGPSTPTEPGTGNPSSVPADKDVILSGDSTV